MQRGPVVVRLVPDDDSGKGSMIKRGGLLALVLLVAFGAAPGVGLAAYSGDNGRIVFERLGGRDGNRPSEIFSIKPDGTGLRRLTDNAVSEGGASVSPSGRRIAFSVGGDTYDSDLFLMDAMGEQRRRLVDLRGGNGSPTWSPDGRWIAFSNIRPRRGADIFIVRRDGESLRRLTDTRADESSPAWSPDGDRIAIISDRKTGLSEVWTMSPSGSAFDRVTRGATVCRSGCEDRYGSIDSLDWSPGGDRIVFSANKGDGPSEIYIAHESGSRVRRIVAGRYPSWSPDGDWLAYSLQGRLYKIRIDGTHRQRLTNVGNDYGTDWGPAK